MIFTVTTTPVNVIILIFAHINPKKLWPIFIYNLTRTTCVETNTNHGPLNCPLNDFVSLNCPLNNLFHWIVPWIICMIKIHYFLISDRKNGRIPIIPLRNLTVTDLTIISDYLEAFCQIWSTTCECHI